MSMTARHTRADDNFAGARKQNKPIGAAFYCRLDRYGLRTDREKGNWICVRAGALPPIRTPDHTRYQVQPEVGLTVNVSGCQPALGSRAGCSSPGVVRGKPAPPSKPERCADPIGRFSNLSDSGKGPNRSPPPVKSISALAALFHTVTEVLRRTQQTPWRTCVPPRRCVGDNLHQRLRCSRRRCR